MRFFLAILLLTAALTLAGGLSSSLAPSGTDWAIGPEIEPSGRGPADLEQATAAELEVAIGPTLEPNGSEMA